LNLRPQRPKRCALANCATPRPQGNIADHPKRVKLLASLRP
jgi:hypothetical protein